MRLLRWPLFDGNEADLLLSVLTGEAHLERLPLGELRGHGFQDCRDGLLRADAENKPWDISVAEHKGLCSINGRGLSA